MKLNRSHRSPVARIVSAVLASAAGIAPMHATQRTKLGTRRGARHRVPRGTETNLQQTPISVSAVTANDINRRWP
jgi:outer membrane receptor for ferrienterochelin and colicin